MARMLSVIEPGGFVPLTTVWDHVLSPSCFSLAWSSAIVSQRRYVLETVTSVLHGTLTTTRHDTALLLKDLSMPLLVPSARVARWRPCVYVLCVLWVLVPSLGYAEQFTGRVVGISDGDTLSVIRWWTR